MIAVKAARLEATNEGGRSRRSKPSASSSSRVELPVQPRRQLTAEQLEQRRVRVGICQNCALTSLHLCLHAGGTHQC